MRNLFLKVISIAAIVMLVATVGITVSAYEYPDEGYWANEAIDAAIDNGLLRGKEDGKIHSEDNLTRAEMAAIMVRSFGATVKADISDYSDLDPSAWYYEDFAKAVQMKVFEGDGTGHMRPNDYITREEVFTVVARAMVLSDSDHSSLNKFKDSSEISSWALDYMSIMAQKSYVNGDETGNVNPKKYITRAEFAQLMYNIFKTYYLTSGSYSDTVDTACVMINTEDVNLTNVVVQGDLIIGDGANECTINLRNVTIEGRLLVRGSATMKLVGTTVGEMVVVNNFNNVVHFDNYKTEPVFKGIVENTKATFKQSGGGSSSSTKYDVTFYYGNTKIDEVSVKSGSTVPEESFPIIEGHVKDSSVSSVYKDAETHKIPYEYWYYASEGNLKEFTKDTVVKKDTDVYLASKRFNVFVNSYSLNHLYASETRFADTVKDILYDVKNSEIILEQLEAQLEDKKADARAQKILDVDDNIKMISAMIKFSQILGKDNVEEFIVDSAKESFGNNDKLEAVFVEYLEEAASSEDADTVAEVKGLMKRTINHVIDDSTIIIEGKTPLTEIKDLVKKILSDEVAFKDITGYDYITDDAQRELVIDEILEKLETPSDDRNNIISDAVNYLVSPGHKDELIELEDYSFAYLNAYSEERDELVDDIIDELYREELDQLVYELINKNQFTLTKKIVFVAEGMKNKIENDYDYETFIGSKIPERLEKAFEIYPEENVKELYNYAIDDMLDQIDTAITLVDAGGTAKIDSGFTVVVNPIADIYVPIYEGMVKLVEDKLSDKYYYSENIYLQELVKLLNPENVVTGSANEKPNELSGYKIKSVDYYADWLYKVAVLTDDAVLWYHKNLEEGEIDKLTDDYQDLVLKYVNIIAENLDIYAQDGTLPNENLTPIEKVIKEKFPEQFKKLVDWYKDSELNKKYSDEDYQDIQDKVYRILQEVNLTTDEFFDRVLNSEYIEDLEDVIGDYCQKVDNDTYKITAKNYTIKFKRELLKVIKDS